MGIFNPDEGGRYGHHYDGRVEDKSGKAGHNDMPDSTEDDELNEGVKSRPSDEVKSSDFGRSSESPLEPSYGPCKGYFGI